MTWLDTIYSIFDDLTWSEVIYSILGTVAWGLAAAWWKYRRRLSNREPSTFGGPRLSRARREAAQARLTPLASLLKSTTDPMARALFLQEVGFELDLPEVEGWARQDPDSATSQLILAEAHIASARRLRSSDAKEGVRERDVPTYAGHLQTAVSLLQDAAKDQPSDPVPWYRLVRIGRFLFLERDLTQAWLREAEARDPECFIGRLEWCAYLSPNWHGTQEELTAYVGETISKASPGSILNGLGLFAMLEEHEAHLTKLALRKANAALRSQAAIAQFDKLCFTLFESEPALSEIESVWAHNYAAYHCCLGERESASRPHFDALANAHPIIPWGKNSSKAHKAFSAAQEASHDSK